MILSMGNQALIFLITAVVGFFIGFIYDIFRIIRKLFKHKIILTQIEDILFWIVVSLFMFFVMLSNNYAQIRAFNVLGAALGALLYFLTAGRLVMAMSDAVIRFLNIPLNFLKKSLNYVKKLLQKLKKCAIIKKSILPEANDTECPLTNDR